MINVGVFESPKHTKESYTIVVYTRLVPFVESMQLAEIAVTFIAADDAGAITNPSVLPLFPKTDGAELPLKTTSSEVPVICVGTLLTLFIRIQFAVCYG